MLKLPVQKDGFLTPNMPLLTGNYLKIMRQQWKDIEFIFIDEISMVPYEMLCMIDSRLRQLKKKDDKPFGGINIIVFGDLMQLPPVKGAQVFNQPRRFLPATHLWRLFSLVELTENMRQQGDTTFADLLNALRVGEMSAQHFDLLMSKMLSEQSGEFAINKAIRIFPLRQQVDDHNTAVLSYYREQPGVRIFNIRAQDRLVDATRNVENINMDTIVPVDINKTGGMPKQLEIFVGAKVMLRSNINLQKGLVNGSMGNIVEVVWPHFRRDQMYDSDVPSVRVDFGRDGVHLIEPRTVQFPAKYNHGTIERRMLPMILCWACTVHKMQGCTVEYAVVYLGKSLFQDGQAYVALSRVRSLEGVRIVELDCSKLTGRKPCNEDAIREMERMRNYQPPNT
jgi:ATP-dependent exoDNAse (exonuclease V) alpha subunit